MMCRWGEKSRSCIRLLEVVSERLSHQNSIASTVLERQVSITLAIGST